MSERTWWAQENERRAQEAELREQETAYQEGQSGPVNGKQYNPMSGTWR